MGLDKKTGYYSLREILGYNAKYNIVLSERGIGKSYGTKIFLMQQPGRFMCLYRQAPDMHQAMAEWTQPLIEQGYDPEDLLFDGNDKEGWVLRYKDEIKGYFRYLTQVNHIKQEIFPDDLDWVWFDEFIPIAYKKLPGIPSEGDALRTIVKTIEHDTIKSREEKGLRPLRVIMFANPFTWNNPLLAYFKIKPVYGVHRVGPDIVCELLRPIERSSDGKMTIDEFIGSDISKTQQWRDQCAFIPESWPKNLIPYMSIRLTDATFALYKKEGTNKIYLKKVDRHPWDPRTIRRIGTLEGLKEDEDCLEYWQFLDVFKGMCYRGRVWFFDLNTKFEFLNRLG